MFRKYENSIEIGISSSKPAWAQKYPGTSEASRFRVLTRSMPDSEQLLERSNALSCFSSDSESLKLFAAMINRDEIKKIQCKLMLWVSIETLGFAATPRVR